ncbi:hypothetical protein WJX72_008463 [[Myrmecia] bisecta]|uniref:Uncharacterized protein n=1 Tax=[Myrmecia] bisecta TaxID=41462 RepID=A0AAW1R8M2_9CHLO
MGSVSKRPLSGGSAAPATKKKKSGPTMTLKELEQQRKQQQQMRDLQVALRSRQPPAVNWACNVLSVLAFQARPELRLAKHPGLLDAILEVLRYSLDPRPLHVRMEVSSRVSSSASTLPPGTPQGWWWEEDGLLSSRPRDPDKLQWAVCVSNIVRNLAITPDNAPPLAEPVSVEVVLNSLDKCVHKPCPALNELAINLLDAMRQIGPSVCLSALNEAIARRLLCLLGSLMEYGLMPLRVRIAAAGALIGLTQGQQNSTVLLSMAEARQPPLLRHLVDLLSTPADAARQAAQANLDGDCGPIPGMEGNPTKASPQAASEVLQAEAVHTAAQAFAELAQRLPNQQILRALVAEPRVVKSLAHLLLCKLPAPGTTTPLAKLASKPAGSQAIMDFVAKLLSLARQHAAGALLLVCSTAGGQEKMVTYEREIEDRHQSGVFMASEAANKQGRLENAILSGPGTLECYVNQNSACKHDPVARQVKAAIDEAVAEVKGPKATVMQAGSYRKSTALQGTDLDMFVNTYSENVTKNERMRIGIATCTNLRASGYYDTQCSLHQKVLRLKSQTQRHPDVDIAFERFKDQTKLPPNRAFSQDQAVSKAVKVVKSMQRAYNLPPILLQVYLV